jgi:hypothetical protein
VVGKVEIKLLHHWSYNFQLMKFFRKFFGGEDKRTNRDNGYMPTRALNLQFTPTPENGLNFAQQFVEAVKQHENIELDYSVDTLHFVDIFLQRFSDEGLTVNDFAETIFVTGSYVGQVMIKNEKGTWVRQEEVKLRDGVIMMPIVVQLPNGNIADPIAKAFKRFHFGETDNISYFYQVFTNHPADGEKNIGS